jgi:hypothetical protein
MTLPEKFRQQLAAYHGTRFGVIAAISQPRQIRCEVVEAPPLAVSFDRLELTTSELANALIAELQAISQELARRITYLLEPIGPIEIDHDSCVIQMRSTPPSQSDVGMCYYELLVRRGGSLSLIRFEKNRGAIRNRLPATVTREVLCRLVDDFCGVLEQP